MSDYNYKIIKECVIEWYKKISSELDYKNAIVLSRNSEDILVIDFDFESCIAQLSVTNSQFVPYQFIYFEAIDVEMSRQGDVKLVYCFYDDESMNSSDVIVSLNNAVKFCTSYKTV